MDRARATVQLVKVFDTDFCGMALDVRDALPHLVQFFKTWAYGMLIAIFQSYGMLVAIFQSALRFSGYTRSQLPAGDATPEPDANVKPLTQAVKGPTVHPSRIERTWDSVVSNDSAKIMPVSFRYPAATRVPDA